VLLEYNAVRLEGTRYMTSEEYVVKLQDLLDKKQQLMSGLLKLTEEQSGAINEESIEQLSKIIAHKQRIIDAVDKLDDEFHKVFNGFKQHLNVESLDQVKTSEIKGADRLKKTVEKIVELIKTISDIDKVNSGKANILLNDLSDKIVRIQGGKKARSAYNPKPIQTASYFIDKKK